MGIDSIKPSLKGQSQDMFLLSDDIFCCIFLQPLTPSILELPWVLCHHALHCLYCDFKLTSLLKPEPLQSPHSVLGSSFHLLEKLLNGTALRQLRLVNACCNLPLSTFSSAVSYLFAITLNSVRSSSWYL